MSGDIKKYQLTFKSYSDIFFLKQKVKCNEQAYEP